MGASRSTTPSCSRSSNNAATNDFVMLATGSTPSCGTDVAVRGSVTPAVTTTGSSSPNATAMRPPAASPTSSIPSNARRSTAMSGTGDRGAVAGAAAVVAGATDVATRATSVAGGGVTVVRTVGVTVSRTVAGTVADVGAVLGSAPPPQLARSNAAGTSSAVGRRARGPRAHHESTISLLARDHLRREPPAYVGLGTPRWPAKPAGLPAPAPASRTEQLDQRSCVEVRAIAHCEAVAHDPIGIGKSTYKAVVSEPTTRRAGFEHRQNRRECHCSHTL